jgi:putative DNA primase/helicase
MTANLRAWARVLSGEVSGKGVVCPGPGHSPRDRSLSVTASATAPDGFIVHSFAGDDALRCKDFVRHRLGLSPFLPGQKRKIAPLRAAPLIEEKAANNREHALRLWDQAVDPRETLVETYLRGRRLELPYEAANEAIRFHPNCPFGSERFPAMVCLVRNILTNEPQGVHRTALMRDGTAVKRNSKTLRMTLGLMAGGAIKLDPDEDMMQHLCIGEGVETSLSGRQMNPELRPAWAAVSAAGIANFPVLPGVDCIRVLQENDANGASAKVVDACARRWYAAGRDVIIIAPDNAKDLNDELMAVIQ